MSELAVGSRNYHPAEHASDPVTSHGDPTPPGKVAIWLFLASEVMFFIGILGSYLILRSGAPDLFDKHAEALNKPLAGVNTVVLLFSSLTMALAVAAANKRQATRTGVFLLLTLLCAGGFSLIKYFEYADKFHHYTVVAMDPATKVNYVYDGHVDQSDAGEVVLHGYRAVTKPGFNINLVSHDDVHADANAKEEREFRLPVSTISQKTNHGPWKNNFYASYFTLTGVHMLHVFGGIVPIFILMVRAFRGTTLPANTEYVGLYWHFVDLVWIFLFPLLYLI